MKKRHFLALIATLFITLGAFAQTGNTYSMVLTLADGTVITIGPNDLTKLDFVEGTLTAEGGTNITDLMNSIKDMQDLLAAVQEQVAKTQMSVKDAVGQIEANKKGISALEASVNDLNESVDALNKSVDALDKSVDAKIADNYDKMKTYTDQAMKNTEAKLKEYTNDAVDLLLAEIAKNKEVITNEYHKAIDDLQTTIRQNTANIETNTADIAGNKANIETNAAGIDKNKDAIIELVKKLRDAGIRI